MVDFVAEVRRQSDRFLDVLPGVDLAARVPSCPDWSLADLIWHLSEVQGFWASIAAGPLDDPGGVARFERPPAPELAALLASQAERLVAALSSHDPATPCWSWHPEGGTIGWVMRRQAHEALIHRVDAELAAGAVLERPGTALAGDGVDEILRVMIHGVPGWGAFTPDGVTARLEAADFGETWTVAFGHFSGTSPDTGNVYDRIEAGAVVDEPGGRPDVVLRADAFDLDLWLWGRGDDVKVVAGDPGLRERLRSLAAESTV